MHLFQLGMAGFYGYALLERFLVDEVFIFTDRNGTFLPIKTGILIECPLHPLTPIPIGVGCTPCTTYMRSIMNNAGSPQQAATLPIDQADGTPMIQGCAADPGLTLIKPLDSVINIITMYSC